MRSDTATRPTTIAAVFVLVLVASSLIVAPSRPAAADTAAEDPDAYPRRGFHDVKGVAGLSSTAAVEDVRSAP